jgi:signal transduction histidine kinase
LKLIGEELISDEVVAASELVKNAHDADAKEVVITFRGVTSEGGEIKIRDDGHGMSLETLLTRWMEPAASTKTGKGRQVTRRGRRVLGEKGVGRFAADKLARHLEIVSRAQGGKDEVRANIDWDIFADDSLLLSDVKNRWEVRPSSEIRKQGMVLRMTGLRAIWTERMFRRLSIRLSRLLSPFREGDAFTIRIESDEFPQYSGELRADFLEKAPYRIEAAFDGLETISMKLNGRAATKQRWNGTGELACGPIRMRMYAFDLEGEALAKIGPRTEVRAWLREWTGLSVYRDGFRVLPYGEPHDDWLRLDQRRVNSPVDHLSNNQVIGFIDIGRDRNPGLIDQTNREGLIHNRALDDLRRLVIFSMQALEAERQSIRHPAKRNGAVVREREHHADCIATELDELADKTGGDIARQLRQMQKRVEEQASKETTYQRQVIDGYSGLAAIGQMAAGLAAVLPHEVGKIRGMIEDLRCVLAKRRVPEARENLDSLTASLARLEEFQRAMSTVTGSADRRRAIDMLAEAMAYRDLIGPWLDSANARMDIMAPEGEVLRTEMRPENFYAVLQILISNAMEWQAGSPCPEMRLSFECSESFCKMLFSDNGPGIPPELTERVFQPLFTRKEGGRGMGLTIARQMVEVHGGHMYLVQDGRRKGANLMVALPRKRSRATVYGS